MEKRLLRHEKILTDTSIMDKAEIKELLVNLNNDKIKAFEESTPNAPAINAIINKLNSLEESDREEFVSFAKSLRGDCFKNGISIKNLSSDFFKPKEAVVLSASSGISQTDKDNYNKVQTDLRELLLKLSKVLAVDLEVLKDHFLIKLETNPLEPYQLMVLHDSTFFFQPIKQKLTSSFSDSEIQFKEIDDYREEMEKGEEKTNVICLLLLNSRTNDEENMTELITNLTSIIDSYISFENITFKQNEASEYLIETSNLKDDFYDEVRYVNGTLLSNGKIKHEEEKIIKKLCSNFNTPLVIYKTLKEGNSGAKVIEVRPKKRFGSEFEKRFIIKYCERDDAKKIKKEDENFGNFIAGYRGFSEYECKYEKTLCHEGIRYSYAISDDESKSYSYHELLNNSKESLAFDIKESIGKLFGINLFSCWRESLSEVECKTKDLYQPYINFDKTVEAIATILNLSNEQVQSNELYINFQKIWEYRMTFNKKVCHGDLHSENFFIDNQGVYLIDFGFTGENHALIDHTSLECSIKFKHIPFYVPEDELELIEDQMLSENAFNLSTGVKGISRKKVTDLIEVVQQIRHSSVGLIVDNNSKMEYYISLFIMTIRQIRYPDMNQRYALNSANKLGIFITNQLGL